MLKSVEKKDVKAPKLAKCATCGKKQAPDYRPFCSKRCADVDLGHWLNEGYALPGDTEIPDPAENEET